MGWRVLTNPANRLSNLINERDQNSTAVFRLFEAQFAFYLSRTSLRFAPVSTGCELIAALPLDAAMRETCSGNSQALGTRKLHIVNFFQNSKRLIWLPTS